MSSYSRIKFFSYIDVLFWSIMVGVGESYISAFTLSYGFSERYSGLVVVLPLGFASIVQIYSGKLFRFFRRRKFLVAFCTFMQAACLILLLYQPDVSRGSKEGLIFLLTGYWFFGLAAGPPWNAWIVSIVPKEHIRNFFAKRGVINQIVLILALMSAGLWLSKGSGSVDFFTHLFAIAGFARLLSTVALLFLPHEQTIIEYTPSSDWKGFCRWIRNRNVIGIILLVGTFRLGVAVGSPYFTPFFLKKMNFSYTAYMLAILAPFFSRGLFFQFAERILDKIGIQKTLFFNLAIIASLPFFWTFEPHLGWLLVFQLLSGIGWGGFEYALLFRQIEDFDKEERSRVLSWTNFIIGLSTIVGVIIGSEFLGREPSIETYKHLFYLSSFMRTLPIFMVFLIDWKSIRMASRKYFVRIVGVRANKGPEVRPIFYSNDQDPK